MEQPITPEQALAALNLPFLTAAGLCYPITVGDLSLIEDVMHVLDDHFDLHLGELEPKIILEVAAKLYDRYQESQNNPNDPK